jgi:hypothetical protein
LILSGLRWLGFIDYHACSFEETSLCGMFFCQVMISIGSASLFNGFGTA